MNEAQLQTLIDKDTIANIRLSFAHYIDTQNWSELTALFTDRVDVDYSDFGIPAKTMKKEEFITLIRNTLTREGVKTQHYISNFNISVEGDRATSIAYVHARHYLPTEGGGNAFDLNGYYTEKLLRTESSWQITAIKLSIQWTEGKPEKVLVM